MFCRENDVICSLFEGNIERFHSDGNHYPDISMPVKLYGLVYFVMEPFIKLNVSVIGFLGDKNWTCYHLCKLIFNPITARTFVRIALFAMVQKCTNDGYSVK